MMALLAFILSIAGFAGLALSMTKHYRGLSGRAPSRSAERGLRTTGWLLLAAALSASVVAYGLSVGLIAWIGLLTVATLIVALLLTYRENGPRARAPQHRAKGGLSRVERSEP